MTTCPQEIAEFYRQLALLVRANLPLPESLRSLAASCENREFRIALERIAAEVDRGVPLAEALRPHRQFFPAFQTQLIAAAERTGTLPEVLFEIARLARFQYALTEQVRTFAVYPFFTVLVAGALFLTLFRFIVPGVAEMVSELTDGARLPWFSATVFALAGVVVRVWLLLVPLYLAAAGYAFWLLSQYPAGQLQLRRLVASLPGAEAMVRHLDWARFCGVGSVLVARQMPLPQIFALTAELVENPGLADGLRRIEAATATGRPLAEVLERESWFPETVRLVLTHTPEAVLPGQLEALRREFEEQAAMTARKLTAFWEMALVLVMVLSAAGVVFALFVPLIQTLRLMSSCG